MTAPIDRAYVEILPLFKGFNQKLQAGIAGPAAAAGKSAANSASAAAASVNKTVAASAGATGKQIAQTQKAAAAGTAAVVKSSGGMFKSIAGNVKGLFLQMAPLAAGFGIFTLIKGGLAAAAEQNAVNRQTAAAIKSTGGVAHLTAVQVGELADSISKTTAVSKDSIQANENLLLTFTNVRNSVGKGNDIFTQATKAVLDMSVALKEDGKSASIQLGKALNDPIKGITALSRVGVAFTAEQKDQIKTLVNHGKTMQAQKIILAELNKEFGGSALAQATAGAKMKNAYHELQVAIGQRLLPVMAKMSTFVGSTVIPGFTKLFDSASKSGGVFSLVGSVFKQLYIVLLPLARTVIAFGRDAWGIAGKVLENQVIPALKSIANFISKHQVLVRSITVGVLAMVAAYKAYRIVMGIAAAAQALFNLVMSANPIAVVIIALVGLTAGIIYAYKHSKFFRDIMDSIGRTMARVGKDIYQFFINLYHAGVATWHAMEEFGRVMTRVGKDIYQFFINLYHVGVAVFHAIDDAWHAIVIAWHATLDFFKRTWHEVVAFLKTWGPLILVVLMPVIGIPLIIHQHWSQIVGFLKRTWDSVWGFLKTWGPLALAVLVPFIGIPLLIYQHFSQIIGFMKRVWSGAVVAVKDGINTALYFIGTLQGRILHLFTGALTWLLGAGHSILTGLVNGANEKLHLIIEFFKAIEGRVKAAVNAGGDWVRSIGRDIINGVWGGLKSAWNTVVGWFNNIPGWIKSALGIHSPPAWAVDAGSWIIKGLMKGLTGGTFSFTSFLAHFASIAKKKLAAIVSSFVGGGGYAGSAQLLNWITAAEKWTGVGSDWTNPLITLIMRESGGNPNSINTTDINAQHGDPSRGLMQTIGATFQHYRDIRLSNNIYDPVSNIVAGIKYILARYGSIFNVQQANANLPPKGYATGAWSVAGNQLAYLHNREMVVPADTADKVRRNAGGKFDVEALARAFAYALSGMCIQFDGDGLARLVTRRQAVTSSKGIRR